MPASDCIRQAAQVHNRPGLTSTARWHGGPLIVGFGKNCFWASVEGVVGRAGEEGCTSSCGGSPMIGSSISDGCFSSLLLMFVLSRVRSMKNAQLPSRERDPAPRGKLFGQANNVNVIFIRKFKGVIRQIPLRSFRSLGAIRLTPWSFGWDGDSCGSTLRWPTLPLAKTGTPFP